MAASQPQSSLGLSHRRSWGQYILSGIIGALAACLAIWVFTPATTLALSQDFPTSADGVFAVPAPLGSDVHGLYLIDTKNQTILLYRYKYAGVRTRGLFLLAARSFRYDRQLLDFNAGKPSPQEVRTLIETDSKAPSPTKAPDAEIPSESGSAPAVRPAPE